MAENEEKTGEEEIDAAEELQRLNRALTRNKWLLVAALSICTVVICVLGTGLTVMFMRISDLSTPPPEQLTMQIAAVEEQLAELAQFRDGELARLEGFRADVNKLRTDCSAAATAPFRDFLVQRETDFQALLKTIAEGTDSLANMTPGARKWVDRHNQALDDLVQQSRMRQRELKADRQ